MQYSMSFIFHIQSQNPYVNNHKSFVLCKDNCNVTFQLYHQGLILIYGWQELLIAINLLQSFSAGHCKESMPVQ